MPNIVRHLGVGRFGPVLFTFNSVGSLQLHCACLSPGAKRWATGFECATFRSVLRDTRHGAAETAVCSGGFFPGFSANDNLFYFTNNLKSSRN
jgi:hypothetical protein